MKLDNVGLHAFFKSENIDFLYHANTLATSLTFIKNGGLLSRGAVESKKLFQTKQSSDNDDKRLNVWNDIFLDTIDLHGYFPRQNLYGPILFKFNIDFLLEKEYDLWITKNNPIYWANNLPDSNRYFQTIEELYSSWDDYDRQKKMITIRSIFDPILFEYIDQVIIDDPQVKVYNTHLFKETVKALRDAVIEQPILKSKFKFRQCQNCYCHSNYLNDISSQTLCKLFLPLDHPQFMNV